MGIRTDKTAKKLKETADYFNREYYDNTDELLMRCYEQAKLGEYRYRSEGFALRHGSSCVEGGPIMLDSPIYWYLVNKGFKVEIRGEDLLISWG